MKKKLKITRTTAYILSSIITVPFLITQQFEPEIIAFMIGMYVIIYFLTRLFAQNYSLKWPHILGESVLTTMVSFIGGLIIASPIAAFGKFGIGVLFLPTVVGIPSSLIIGLALFIMNYVGVLIIKNIEK
ncbi:MAG: hypothetical protein N4A35_08905 [Flavobacteriales bacterium]|jgi:hypothetical protein|nr:hypothetical protein [Flavobacteriales bacterium]